MFQHQAANLLASIKMHSTTAKVSSPSYTKRLPLEAKATFR
jgi:hypothetical protein